MGSVIMVCEKMDVWGQEDGDGDGVVIVMGWFVGGDVIAVNLWEESNTAENRR